MLKELVRTALRPLTFLVSSGLGGIANWRLGPAGLVELRLDPRLKHPLVVLRHVEEAVMRPGVRGLLLHVDALPWGWATLEEWREALNRMRGEGKLVVIAAQSPGNREMVLCSVADRVIVPPMGEVAMVGVGGSLRFMGPLLERFGLRFDVEAAGAYKSLGESFTRAYPSPENREAMELLIDDMHQGLLEAVSEGRRLSIEEVQALVDRCPMSAEEAREAGLIDAVGYEDRLDEELERLLGDKVRRVGLNNLEWLFRAIDRLDAFLETGATIAVLHLEGNVTTARNPSARPRISPEEVMPALRAVREHPAVKGVVLHVDSPGGSVLASDLIWNEVARLQKEKPVVACFGDVAASGGYYISAPVDTIVARRGTITGSIGVVGGKLVTGGATQALGVFSEAITRGRNVGMYSPETPFDPEQRARFKARLEETYEGFVKRVASGRGRTYEEIEPLARGRVWSGAAAAERGLVDSLGGLDEALRRVRAKAELQPNARWRRWDILVRPRRNLLMELLPSAAAAWSTGAAERVLQSLGLELPPLAEALLESPNQPLAVLPAEVDLR